MARWMDGWMKWMNGKWKFLKKIFGYHSFFLFLFWCYASCITKKWWHLNCMMECYTQNLCIYLSVGMCKTSAIVTHSEWHSHTHTHKLKRSETIWNRVKEWCGWRVKKTRYKYKHTQYFVVYNTKTGERLKDKITGNTQ